MPPEIRLVLLSATLDKPEAFASWLGEIKQVPCWLLATNHRVVPLEHAIYTEGLTESLLLKRRDEDPVDLEVYRAWLRSRQATLEGHDKWKETVKSARKAGESAAGRDGKVVLKSFTHRMNECIGTLQRKDLLPALFFSFSRQNCEKYANQVTGSLLTSSEVADVKHILSFHLHRYMDVLETLPQYHQIVRLLERGIAFHHSGLLPLLKEAVELLFGRGFVRVLFATETFAIGLNMPTRTVVFTGLEKPSGDGFRTLRYDEYTQMAGRAGRRGKDTKGSVFYLPSHDPVSAEDLCGCMAGALVPLQSRLQFQYDFVIKALHLGAQSPSEIPLWIQLLSKSYWTIQRNEALAKLAAEAAALRSSAVAVNLSAEQAAAFTEKADLEGKARTLTNSKQKAARLALARWSEDHSSAAWKVAEKAWLRKKSLEDQAAMLESQLADVSTGEERLEPVLAALKEWGFLEGVTLTHKGVLATEVNEGNPILMVELYTSGILKDAAPSEIVATLAAQCGDVPRSADQGKYPHLVAADFLASTAKRGSAIDSRYGVEYSPDSWTLSPYWPSILYEWMEGADAAHLTESNDLYAANLMRGILKAANLLNEWIAMATFCGDLAMLDKLKDVPVHLLRGIAQPESLYLHL